MNKLLSCAVAPVLAVTLCFATSAQAQSCGPTYAPQDRTAVRAVFYNATALMQRMHELSFQSATMVLSSTQRSALSYEFIALRSEIERIGNEVRGVRRATARFLDRVVDPTFLRIDDETIWGADQSAAVINATHAGMALFDSQPMMWGCL